MIKSALAAIAFFAAVGGAAAQTATPMPWSDQYTLSAFETVPANVATATDTQTGKSFNVVKLANGKMMVLMSLDRVKALTPFADDSEMMFSGHGGTTR
ncbi:hypothetical protein [Methylobacterium marchantiae]|uniref:Uncharacterized protein n=1 Tax=Methylobacterium marchantiae TaxID=600331 RepID=A0ABW3WVP7_9HYPH|nr:hypothetical protein AIGOOFII_0557 [Methylobacterium marchantiae]